MSDDFVNRLSEFLEKRDRAIKKIERNGRIFVVTCWVLAFMLSTVFGVIYVNEILP